MPQLSPRGRLIRDAVIYTPIFALCLAVLLFMIAGVIDRAPVALVLLVIVTFLFGYQSIQSLRDLVAEPETVEGPVLRRWTKRDAFVAKSYYVAVNKAIFRIPVDAYMDTIVGDTVRIVAYPHTGTVVEVERLKREEKPAPEEAPEPEARPATGRMRTLRTARATPSARRQRDADEPGGRDTARKDEGEL